MLWNGGVGYLREVYTTRVVRMKTYYKHTAHKSMVYSQSRAITY